jgi:arabinogalactan endo-1,4-beta-galactosidase
MRATDALHSYRSTVLLNQSNRRSSSVVAVCCAAALLCLSPRPAPANALPFYMGGDISLDTFISQQVANAGGQFTDNDGVAKPLEQIMYDHGANLFRLRIFVNPQTTYATSNSGAMQTTAYDIALAQQIKANAPGAKLILDFHMSDTWADPGHQTPPSAWTGQSLAVMETSVTNYTQSTLQSFYDAGVTPDIVQIGNETTSGILWNNGKLNFSGTQSAQNASWAAYGGLLNAGITGVRNLQSVNNLPRIPVALSIDSGDKDGQPQYHYGMLQKSVVVGGSSVGGGGVTDFDVEGVDYYPSNWSSTGKAFGYLQRNLIALANTNTSNGTNSNPSKRIMLLENNYPYMGTANSNSEPITNYALNNFGTGSNNNGGSGSGNPWPATKAGQEQEFLDVRNMMMNLPGNDGEGLLWWYPEGVQVPGVSIFNGGNTALFDNTSNHNALPILTDNTFAPIRGDFNGDGHFNAADIPAMVSALGNLSAYQTNRAFTNPDMKFLGDFDGDGVITNADLQGMINSLIAGQGSSDPVPEPAAGWLLGVATLAVVIQLRRRRMIDPSARPVI